MNLTTATGKLVHRSNTRYVAMESTLCRPAGQMGDRRWHFGQTRKAVNCPKCLAVLAAAEEAAYAEAAEMEMDDSAANLAAAVISEARDDFNQGAAGFDYAIAGGRGTAEQSLQNAIYIVANPSMTGHPAPEWLEERRERASALAEMIAEELEAFRARCRSRKYVGWSSASRGPIRYAD